MGRISEEDIARVRDATDLVSLVSERVLLRQRGRLFWGNCPFHGEKTPSFKIDPATQLWHCFGCGAGGDVYGFVMRSDNVEFPEAVRLLAARAHIELHETEGGVPRGTKERLYAVLAETAGFYHKTLTGSREQGPTKAREYLASRGFGSRVAKSWNLGYAPGRGLLVAHLTKAGFGADEMVGANVAIKSEGGQLKDRFFERVMFPISDLQGRVVGFGGRVMGPAEPKYLNTNETPVFHKSANLYGIERAKGPITASGTAVVVEGYTDVIALHEAGVTNAVATLGTALTQQHIRLLGRFARRIVYLFDGDEAGMRAADRATEFIDGSVTPEAGRSRIEVDVAVIPDGLDPADYVAERGADAIHQVVSAAEPLLRFAIERRLARWDLSRPEERMRALAEAAEVLAPIKDSLLADDYTNHIADRLFADFKVVKRAISAARIRPRVRTEEGDGAERSSAGALESPKTPEWLAQRDLMALLVQRPELRSKAQELLLDSLWSDPLFQEMARALADAEPGMEPAALMGMIEQTSPGSASVLSGSAVMEEEGEQTEALMHDLIRRLKEFDLERRIAAGMSRLRSPEVIKDKALSDEILKDVSAMQRDLDALRRAAAS